MPAKTKTWERTAHPMRLRWPMVIMLSAALAGCSMEASTQVTDTGGGSLSTAIGLAPADATALSQLGLASSQDFCQKTEARTKLPATGTITQEQRGDTTWCVENVPFENLGQLARPVPTDRQC